MFNLILYFSSNILLKLSGLLISACTKICFISSLFKFWFVTFNASLLKSNTSEKLLYAGLGEIIIGIDSMNKKNFEKVRRDLIFEEVIENTLSHIKIRDKYDYNSKIMIRMIISKENSGEWESYKKYWSKLLNFNKGDMILYFPEHNWSDHDYPNADGSPKIVEKNVKI